MLGISGLRGRHLFFLDLVVIALSIVGAMLLRFDTLHFVDEALIYFPAALFPLIVRPPINVLGGLYSRAWAYASVGELVRILVVVLAGSMVGIVFFYGLLVPLGVQGTETAVGRFPRSFFVLEGMLTLAGMGGARFLIRASTDWQGWGLRDRGRLRGGSETDGGGRVPTLVYGAGDVGATVLRTISAARDGLGMRVVGLLDDDRSKRNQVLRGQRVLGSRQLRDDWRGHQFRREHSGRSERHGDDRRQGVRECGGAHRDGDARFQRRFRLQGCTREPDSHR